uniref:Perforin-1-like n=1 Tax=Poecilia reticulata TaxID=8081 RepID=A0A3P9QII4_POERE
MLPDSTSALLLLSVLLVPSSVLSCRLGTQTECDAAPFVPGHNLVGEGFDVVTMERKRAHVINVKTYLTTRNICFLCSNPLQNDALQKLPSSVVDFFAIPRCNPEIHSSFHTSAGLDVEKILLDNFDVGGTGSNIYKFVSQRSKEDHYTFSIHSVTCNHYGIILSTTPPLSLEFEKQLDLLPSHYNYSTKNEYRKFIQTYGTHYFRTVHLGGRLKRVTSSRSCLSSMNGLTPSEVTKILKNQDSATNFSSGLHQHFTEVSGGNGWLGEFSIFQNDSIDYMNWLKSLKEHPDVVSYSLRPLYQLIRSKSQKAGMKAAIEQYLQDNAVKKSLQERHCEATSPNCCPLHASRGTLSVTIVRAWNLNGDVFGPTDGWVDMYYGSMQRRTKMIESDNPQWNAEFNLGEVIKTFCPIVWDEDWKYDDLLGKCEKYLNPGTHTFTCNIGEFWECKHLMSSHNINSLNLVKTHYLNLIA